MGGPGRDARLAAALARRFAMSGDRPQLAVIVAARNEADRMGATVVALREAFPGAAIWVADDASSDGTAEVAMAAGARRRQPRPAARQGGQRDAPPPKRR